MNVQAPFGFATGCHAGDKFMVQATLASMRYYCPQVPVCLVVDGNFDVSDLEREYAPIILRISDLPAAEMRALIGGDFRAKLAAMWEGPFEFYVWLDSDAIVWGDFTPQIRSDIDFQIFWSEISIPPNAGEVPAWLPHYYFNPDKLQAFDPQFDWRGHAYFCTGAFASRRNALPFDRWLEVESWARQTPGLFAFGEMGMMNYLVHALAQCGTLRTTMTDLQHLWGHHGTDELVWDCADAGWHFPPKIARPRVAHFCGRKPYLYDRKAYSRPFTIARLEHHRRSQGNLGAWRRVLQEDGRVLINKISRRLSGVKK